MAMAARQDDRRDDAVNDLEAIIAHSSPGRLRLRVSKVIIDSGAAEGLSRAFDAQAGVITARVNSTARCVVVHYDERATHTDALVLGLGDRGVRLRLMEAAPESRPPTGQTPLSRWISGKASEADERMRGASGGSADLRTLVPISLAALAVREILSGRATAVPWYAFAWYAFDTFIKLRRPGNGTEQPPV